MKLVFPRTISEKEKKVNIKDIFKNTPKIRAVINQEQYGLKTKIN